MNIIIIAILLFVCILLGAIMDTLADILNEIRKIK